MRTMSKYFFFAAAFVALASCSNDNYVGDNSPTMGGESGNGGAIVFSSGTNGTTRADHEGADAAALLNKHFTVGGFKGDGSTRSTVFDNYIVNWTANTAGRTESNTSDWEYVGISAVAPSTITGSQTIKFWDYSATQYDFVAYSTGARTATTGEPVSGTSVKVTAIDPANLTTAAYTLKGASRADLAGCYVADMVTAYKGDNPATFGKEVKLTFRNLASKVRMAIYETVPGYSVKDVKFYTAHPTTLGSGSNTTATLIGTMNDAGTYTVKFPTIGSTNKSNADYNRAHVTFASTATSANQTYGSLNYVAKESREKTTGSQFLGRTSTTASFAGTSPYYQTVLPNETGVVFELAIDYTLESIDGSGEEIHVYGATAYVPVQFTKWQPNFAYTYIFKISDNSNGWTSTVTTDPAGLYPITFDAVVAEALDANNEQTTITTVASPSITTYQKGHDTTKDEYSAAKGKIYVQVMVDGSLKNDLGTKGHLYTVTTTDAAISEATVLDALNIIETGTTGRNGITLTAETSDATITAIPSEGGNISVSSGEAAEFTPTAPTSPATVKYYAYVYDTGTWNGIAVKYATEPADLTTACYTDKACTTLATAGTFSSETTYYRKQSYIYTAVSMTSTTAPSDWTTAGVWWKDPDGKAAVDSWDAANNGKVFYKRYAVDTKVYGVKVIKVVN